MPSYPKSLVQELATLFKELCGYLVKTSDEGVGDTNKKAATITPPWAWCVYMMTKILQQFPQGITRSVLLAELELRWKASIRRGEHSGRLKRALSTKQLAPHDILEGRMKRIDDFRVYIDAGGENCGCEMILHRQFTDLVAFTKHYTGLDFLDDRDCRMVQCRLMRSHSAMLVPTPSIIFIIDLHSSQHTAVPSSAHANACSSSSQLPILDKKTKMADFFCRVLLEYCRRFYASFVSESSRNHVNATLTEEANSKNQVVVLASVVSFSKIYQHPHNSSSYCVVRLRVFNPSQLDPSTPSVHTNLIDSASLQIVCLILRDEQATMVSLWNIGDILLLYRPFIALNSDEILFGRKVKCPNYHSMEYNVIEHPADGFEDQNGDSNISIHFLYGDVTVVSKVIGLKNADRDLTPHAIQTSTSLSSLRSDSMEILSRLGLKLIEQYSKPSPLTSTMISSPMLHSNDSLKFDKIDCSKCTSFICSDDLIQGMHGLTLLTRIIMIDKDPSSVSSIDPSVGPNASLGSNPSGNEITTAALSTPRNDQSKNKDDFRRHRDFTIFWADVIDPDVSYEPSSAQIVTILKVKCSGPVPENLQSGQLVMLTELTIDAICGCAESDCKYFDALFTKQSEVSLISQYLWNHCTCQCCKKNQSVENPSEIFDGMGIILHHKVVSCSLGFSTGMNVAAVASPSPVSQSKQRPRKFKANTVVASSLCENIIPLNRLMCLLNSPSIFMPCIFNDLFLMDSKKLRRDLSGCFIVFAKVLFVRQSSDNMNSLQNSSLNDKRSSSTQMNGECSMSSYSLKLMLEDESGFSTFATVTESTFSTTLKAHKKNGSLIIEEGTIFAFSLSYREKSSDVSFDSTQRTHSKKQKKGIPLTGYLPDGNEYGDNKQIDENVYLHVESIGEANIRGFQIQKLKKNLK